MPVGHGHVCICHRGWTPGCAEVGDGSRCPRLPRRVAVVRSSTAWRAACYGSPEVLSIVWWCIDHHQPSIHMSISRNDAAIERMFRTSSQFRKSRSHTTMKKSRNRTGHRGHRSTRKKPHLASRASVYNEIGDGRGDTHRSIINAYSQTVRWLHNCAQSAGSFAFA